MKLERLRTLWRLMWVFSVMALAGCVVGYGQCQFLRPLKSTLTGRVHFKDYPNGDGIDNVAVLSLDKTAYIYAPAQSMQCLPANDIQMLGVSEFPHDVGEDTPVTVTGTVFQAGSDRQHTSFVINVLTILPIHKSKVDTAN